MRRRALLGIAADLMASMAAGCIGGGSDGGSSGSGGNGSGNSKKTTQGGGTKVTKAGMTVEMVDTTFDPVQASVEAGTTVKWINRDSFAHTVTSTQFHGNAASWNLDKRVSKDGSVTHTFDTKGVYEYYCTIHGKGTMCGVILVSGASLDQSLPCEGGSGGTTSGGDSGGGGGGY